MPAKSMRRSGDAGMRRDVLRILYSDMKCHHSKAPDGKGHVKGKAKGKGKGRPFRGKGKGKGKAKGRDRRVRAKALAKAEERAKERVKERAKERAKEEREEEAPVASWLPAFPLFFGVRGGGHVTVFSRFVSVFIHRSSTMKLCNVHT